MIAQAQPKAIVAAGPHRNILPFPAGRSGALASGARVQRPQQRPLFEIPEERLQSILHEPSLPRFAAMLKQAAAAGNAGTPPSSGHGPGGQPCSATAALSRHGRKARRLTALAKAARRVAQKAERRMLLGALQARAAAEEWSGRELARRIGLPWSSWCKILSGADPTFWLPRIREAACSGALASAAIPQSTTP